jgi:small-conductance mechanosensitive channel
LSSLLTKGGLREPPSLLLSRFAGGLVVFSFFLIALSILNLKVLDHLIERVFNYLPNVFVTGIIVMLGYMLGNFFGRAALIASVNAGMQLSRLIGRSVRYLIFILTMLIALEQLGIGKESVLLTFAIMFSGIVLAMAIAFGLGGKDLAREYLERKLKDRQAEDGIHHL